MKVQAAWINQFLGSHFTRRGCFPVKFAKFLKTTFENTNNSVEHLRSCYLQIVDFVIIPYHSHLRIFVKYVTTFL